MSEPQTLRLNLSCIPLIMVTVSTLSVPLEDVDAVFGHFCSDLRAFCVWMSSVHLMVFLLFKLSGGWGGMK